LKDPAWHPVIAALRELYEAAGRPSYRVIGERAKVSHTTVHNALTGNGPPGISWPVVEAICRALDGDPDQLRPTFQAIEAGQPPARRAERQIWRQDVVAAAWATLLAWQAGEQQRTAEAIGRLETLFASRP
jgi:hypothetical protein